jgi:hypothetical protein
MLRAEGQVKYKEKVPLLQKMLKLGRILYNMWSFASTGVFRILTVRKDTRIIITAR